MTQRRTIAVVDCNSRRRAAMVRSLLPEGIHVEPFEAVDELELVWPRAEAILIEDSGDAVADLIALMAEHGRWLPVIAYAEMPCTDRVVRAVLAGSIDYLPWPCTAEQVLGAMAGASATGAALGSLKLREARARSRVQCLSRREREVLAGVAGGLSNRGIGRQLAISPRTVEIHRANMLHKIGARHTSEAIRIAIEASVVA